jgi:hypothetical protein
MKITGMFCPRCDKSGTPRKVMAGTDIHRDGMTVACDGCGLKMAYTDFMALNPRMEKIVFQEKQPQGTVRIETWIIPEVLEMLKKRFPSNLLTTLNSLYSSVADPDTVLVEGEYARQLADLGVKRGREVLGLAKEVKDLRERNKELELQMKVLGPIIAAMTGQKMQAPQADFSVPEQSFSMDGEPGDPNEHRPAFITSLGR